MYVCTYVCEVPKSSKIVSFQKVLDINTSMVLNAYETVANGSKYEALEIFFEKS